MVRLSDPGRLVKLLRAELGDARAAQVLEAANSAPERCLRANRMRGGVEAAINVLSGQGFKIKGVEGLPDGLLYDGPPLERSEAFTGGLVTPQSRGSQVAGLVAAGAVTGPGARVLDVCAVPGAKTSQLASLPAPGAHDGGRGGRGACGRSAEPTSTRLGAAAVEVVRADALELPGSWDGTFVLYCSTRRAPGSAPSVRARTCAGGGTSWTCRASRSCRRGSSRAPPHLVKPGGALTYAVCTVTRAETLGVVEPLLAGGGWAADDLGAVWPGLAHPEAGGFLLMLPPDAGSTGFFVARLRRQAR